MTSPLRNQPAPEDQRNVIIATILVAVILFAWMFWMSPQQPRQQQAGAPADTAVASDTAGAATAPQPDTSSESAGKSAEAGTTPNEAEAPPTEPPSPTPAADRYASLSALAADSITASAARGTNRKIVVQTDVYTAVLSTKGGTLQRFTLEKYKQFNQEDPVQLVDTTTTGALSVAFRTPTGRLVDSRDLYFTPSTEADTIRVEGASTTITFEASLGDGVLRQAYTFHPDNYDLGLSVQQVRPASFATSEGYELVWHGGVPYSEGGEEDELRFTGLYAQSEGTITSLTLSSKDHSEKHVDGSISWLAVKNKYFTAALMPDDPDRPRGASLVGDKVSQATSAAAVKNLTGRVQMPRPRGKADVDEFHLYAGPIDYYNLADYGRGLYGMVDYGWDWFEWITKPLAKYLYIPMLTYLGSGLPSWLFGGGIPYGIVVILMAIFIKTLVYPLTKSSYRSMAKMRELQPKMQEIKDKYDDEPDKQQEEMMQLYRETGVNPIGGCLPMFLQYPILISLYQFIPKSIQLRQKSFLWASDLSAPDKILELPFTIPFYGDYVAGFTLLMGLAMIVTMRVQTTGGGAAGGQAKMLQYAMPAVIFFIFNRFASALSLYYLFYNIVTAAQQKWINMQLEKEKDEEGKLTAGGDGEAEGEKGFFGRIMERAEEAQKQQR
ncbi:MAG: membrane protein insertase YidC [Salinibacter sp.]|uniref:membrane protein insertase YidC n=1 Tax=Salinibacter sp. TaxID=2065818 RepID=UPI0035D512AF